MATALPYCITYVLGQDWHIMRGFRKLNYANDKDREGVALGVRIR